jgi:RHS repeat-associated protein
VIAPHATWRGSYDRGTPITGQCLVYSSNGKMLAPPPDSTPASGDQYNGVAGGGTYSGTAEHCVEVDWPASYTWSARQYRRGYAGPSAWMGSLIFESRDASGLYYRRNRYYDSEKGRFTQEDPIGLAGGINIYGFANGDPITYDDPTGLCPPCIAYAIAEAAGTVYDAVDVGRTVAQYRRGQASGAAVLLSAGGALAGAVAPGFGYGRGARAVAEHADDLARGGTYLLRDASGTVMRTGRSNNLARRAAEHARDPQLRDLVFEVDKRTDNYAAQRGREQIIHDLHQPPLNRVRPVSPKNQRLETYLKEGRDLQ